MDVVMETDNAGLDAIKALRERGFKLPRVVVRTGFPGEAPERRVIVDYDIHDYLEKSGTSAQKLFTTLISALRAYSDLQYLEEHRNGLLRVLESVSWFDFNAVGRYVAGMLAEYTNLVRVNSPRMFMAVRASDMPESNPVALGALGDWDASDVTVSMASLPPEVAALVRQTLDTGGALSGAGGQTLFCQNFGIDLAVYAAGDGVFWGADEVLLEVFLNAVCQAVSNQKAFADMAEDRNAVLHAMALRRAGWNQNAAVELARLSHWANALAQRLHTTLAFPLEIDGRFLRDIGVAAQLHDVGNDLVDPALLELSAVYTPEQRGQMQAHVAHGLQIADQVLQGSKRPGALQLARQTIAAHHENFDGTGYPHGLAGEAIPLAARLVAVADVYVALTSARSYRPAMEAVAAQDWVRAQSGRRLDPLVVQAFFELIESGFGD